MEPSASETLRRRITLLTELKVALSEYRETQAAAALEAIHRLLPLAGDYVYQTSAAAQLHEPKHLVSALFQIPTDPAYHDAYFSYFLGLVSDYAGAVIDTAIGTYLRWIEFGAPEGAVDRQRPAPSVS